MLNIIIDELNAQGRAAVTVTNYVTSWNRLDYFLNLPINGLGGGATPFDPYIKRSEKIDKIFKKSLETDTKYINPAYATQRDLADFKRYLIEKFSPATTELTFKHLNVIYRILVQKGVIPDSPVANIKVDVKARVAPKWLTRNQENSLERAVREKKLTCKKGSPSYLNALKVEALIIFMLGTGLRVGEVVNVRLEDLAISERSGAVFVRAGSNDFERTVPLKADTRKALTEYLMNYTPKGDYLFDSQRSDKMTTRAVQHIVEKFADELNIEGLSAHTLRHTFAHNAVQVMTLDEVAQLLGHFKKNGAVNVAQTVVYTSPSVEDLAKKVEKMSTI